MRSVTLLYEAEVGASGHVGLTAEIPEALPEPQSTMVHFRQYHC